MHSMNRKSCTGLADERKDQIDVDVDIDIDADADTVCRRALPACTGGHDTLSPVCIPKVVPRAKNKNIIFLNSSNFTHSNSINSLFFSFSLSLLLALNLDVAFRPGAHFFYPP